jgi:hypothetical protein
MIPHIPVFGLTLRAGSVSLLSQLDDGDPQVLDHPAVAKLLGLPDARLVGGSRLVLASQVPENLAQTAPGVAFILTQSQPTCPLLHRRRLRLQQHALELRRRTRRSMGRLDRRTRRAHHRLTLHACRDQSPDLSIAQLPEQLVASTGFALGREGRSVHDLHSIASSETFGAEKRLMQRIACLSSLATCCGHVSST